DSIIFRVFSLAEVDSASLPSIFIEDAQNRKTPRQKLSVYINGIAADNWQRISVPLSPFFQNPGDVDLTQIKTIYFGQNNPDGSLHTLYLDEIRIISVNDTDTVSPEVPSGLTAEGHTTTIELTWIPIKNLILQVTEFIVHLIILIFRLLLLSHQHLLHI